MEIIPAKEEDATEISNLINRSYRGEEALEGWTTEAGFIIGDRSNPSVILKEMREPGLSFLKCVDNSIKEIVGCVYLKINEDGKEAHTGMLTVLPKMQSKGIGRLLMDAAETMAINNGCTSISMQITSVRDSLIAWYKRRGFRDTGIRHPFPPKEANVGVPKFPLEFMWMEKIL